MARFRVGDQATVTKSHGALQEGQTVWIRSSPNFFLLCDVVTSPDAERTFTAPTSILKKDKSAPKSSGKLC